MFLYTKSGNLPPTAPPHCIVDDAIVPVRFLEDQKIYPIDWTELLQVGSEIPFQEYDDLQLGIHVLPPWSDGSGVRFSEGVVVKASGKFVCFLLGYI